MPVSSQVFPARRNALAERGRETARTPEALVSETDGETRRHPL